jgi:hypothetical protein
MAIKINYAFNKLTKITDDVTIRRFILSDLVANFPEIDDLEYQKVMNLDLFTLCAIVE